MRIGVRALALIACSLVAVAAAPRGVGSQPSPPGDAVPLSSPIMVSARAGSFRAVSFDGHVHSDVSLDARHPVRTLVQLAQQADLDALFLTDHGSTRGVPRGSTSALDPVRDTEVALHSGAEVGGAFGHCVVWNVAAEGTGVHAAARASLAALGRTVHAHGGLVVLAHPGWWIRGNRYDPRRWMHYDALRRGGIAEEVDALELWNGVYPRFTELLVDDWISLIERGVYVPLVGNSDFHDSGLHRFGAPRNVAFCPAGADARRPDCALEAVRRGRLYVTDGPSIAWTAGGLLPGEILVAAPGTPVELTIDVRAPTGGTLEVYLGHDRVEARPLAPGEPMTASFVVPMPARDRPLGVRVRRDSVVEGGSPFSLLSNPVLLDPPPAREHWRGPVAERPVPAPWGFRRGDRPRRRWVETERQARRRARRARRLQRFAPVPAD